MRAKTHHFSTTFQNLLEKIGISIKISSLFAFPRGTQTGGDVTVKVHANGIYFYSYESNILLSETWLFNINRYYRSGDIEKQKHRRKLERIKPFPTNESCEELPGGLMEIGNWTPVFGSVSTVSVLTTLNKCKALWGNSFGNQQLQIENLVWVEQLTMSMNIHHGCE